MLHYQVERMEALGSLLVEVQANAGALGDALTNVHGWLPVPGMGSTLPPTGRVQLVVVSTTLWAHTRTAHVTDACLVH